MKRTKTIKWLRDYSGDEPEIPQGERIKYDSLKWSYKKGQQIRVQVLLKNVKEQHCFFDIRGGHQISGIPDDAFYFLD